MSANVFTAWVWKNVHGNSATNCALLMMLLLHMNNWFNEIEETNKLSPRSLIATCLTGEKWEKLGHNKLKRMAVAPSIHTSRFNEHQEAFYRYATESFILILRNSCSSKAKCWGSKKNRFTVWCVFFWTAKNSNQRGWLIGLLLKKKK